MSEQIIRRSGMAVDMQSTLPWLMAMGAYALLLVLGPRLLSDPDTYSHIALGRWIVAHHVVPTTDPFSANFRGVNWVAFEWLSQIAFAGAHAVGGWLGVVALSAAAVAAALGLLTRFLALSQVRHADLLGMLAPIFLARPLAEQFKAIAADGPVSAPPHRMLLPIVILAVLTGTTALASLRDIAPATRISPANAIQFVELAKAGPVLNDYDFGGYLDFVGIAPFIDGRAELYGERYMLRHDRALSLQNLPDFLRLLDEYRIQATLLAPSTPAVGLLDRLPEWKRAYTDDVAVVHMRR